jgi:DNA-binding NtrC family response regulator
MEHVTEARVFVLDLDLPSRAGSALRGICERSEAPRVDVTMHVSGACQTDGIDNAAAGLVKENDPDVVFFVLPRHSSEISRRTIEAIRSQGCNAPVIAVVQDGCSEELIALLKSGVVDFVTPPLSAVDVLPRIWRLLEVRRRDPLVEKLKRRIGLRQLVGDSPMFLTELEKIPYIAKSNATVLISGETGTGKELFARAIHYLGLRSGHPFVPVNCGSIPVELVENERFGHARGAFTGAHAEHAGLIQDAHGGTVFLDEIDCLPLSAQVKLLRFLQDREYRQLGSAKVIHADVRVIAATNIELCKAVDEGTFRRDLFYRLNVIPVALPALRDRREDIPALACHFLHKHASDIERDIPDFTDDALQKLALYDWPGNVRELENVIERAVVFSTNRVIGASDIPLADVLQQSGTESFQGAKARAVEKFEKDYLRSLLVACGGNISRAAKAAQKNRRAFWELIRKHNINVQELRSSAQT